MEGSYFFKIFVQIIQLRVEPIFHFMVMHLYVILLVFTQIIAMFSSEEFYRIYRSFPTYFEPPLLSYSEPKGQFKYTPQGDVRILIWQRFPCASWEDVYKPLVPVCSRVKLFSPYLVIKTTNTMTYENSTNLKLIHANNFPIDYLYLWVLRERKREL